MTFVLQSANTVCRAATGVCDVAETCSGNSATCPDDDFATSSTVCRPSISVSKLHKDLIDLLKLVILPYNKDIDISSFKIGITTFTKLISISRYNYKILYEVFYLIEVLFLNGSSLITPKVIKDLLN